MKGKLEQIFLVFWFYLLAEKVLVFNLKFSSTEPLKIYNSGLFLKLKTLYKKLLINLPNNSYEAGSGVEPVTL